MAAAATFTSGTGTVTFGGGAAQTLTPGGIDATHDFYNLTVNKAGLGVTLAAAIQVNGALTLTSGTLNAAGFAMTVGGNWTNSGGTFTPGTGLVTLSGTCALSSGASVFYDLTIAATGAVTPQDALTVNRHFTINAGGTYTHNAQALILGGAGGVIGNVTDSTAVKQNLGAVTVSTAAKTATTSLSMSSLTITSQLSKGAANTLTVSGALNAVGGTLDGGLGGTINVGGNLTLGTLANMAGTTLILNGGVLQTVVPNAQTFGDVRDSNTSAQVRWAGTATVSDLLVDLNAAFVLGLTGAATLNVSNGAGDDVTVSAGGQLRLDGTLGPVSLAMTDLTQINNVAAGGIIVASSTSLVTIGSVGVTTTLIGNEIDYNGNILHVAGFSTAVATTLVANDRVILDTGLRLRQRHPQRCRLRLHGGGQRALLRGHDRDGGHADGGHRLHHGDRQLDRGRGGGVRLGHGHGELLGRRGADADPRGVDANHDFNNLTVNKTVATVLTLAGAIQVNGALDVQAGTLNVGAGNFAIGVNGNWTVAAAATFTSGTGTVTFGGGAAQTLTPGGIDATHDFYNLTVNKAGLGVTLAAAIQVNGALTLTAGTLNAAGFAMTVGGNWTNSGGTFTPGTGLVTLSGTCALSSGASVFYDLTIAATGAVTPQDALTVNRHFTINAGGTYTHNAQALILGGAGGVIGNVTDSTAVKQNLGAVTVSTAAKTATTSLSMSSLTITSQLSKGAANTLTVSGALNAVGGTLDGGLGGTINVGGDLTLGTLANMTGTTLILNGGVLQTVVPNAQTFGDVRDSNTSAQVRWAGTATVSDLLVDLNAAFVLGLTGAATLNVSNGAGDDVTVSAGGQLRLDGTLGPVSLAMTDLTQINNVAAGGIIVANSASLVTIGSVGVTTTLIGNEIDYNGNILHVAGFSTAVATTLVANDRVILDTGLRLRQRHPQRCRLRLHGGGQRALLRGHDRDGGHADGGHRLHHGDRQLDRGRGGGVRLGHGHGDLLGRRGRRR